MIIGLPDDDYLCRRGFLPAGSEAAVAEISYLENTLGDLFPRRRERSAGELPYQALTTALAATIDRI